MGSGDRQGVWVRGAVRVYGFGGPAGCMGSGGRQGVWVREAGRVYGFGEPAGCMGSGGSQGVWVREAGRMYGFGGRQDVLVRGVGIQVGMGHSILMTGVLLRTSQSMRDCR